MQVVAHKSRDEHELAIDEAIEIGLFASDAEGEGCRLISPRTDAQRRQCDHRDR